VLKIQIFIVTDSGETEEVQTDQNVGDVLNTGECYLLFDELGKCIWLWKGKKARIRSKFIAAKKSQEMRGQVGLSNRVVSIDEGEEPPEFLNVIGSPPRAGEVVAQEIRAEASPSFMNPNVDQAPPSFSTSNFGQEEESAPAPKPKAKQPVAKPVQQVPKAKPATKAVPKPAAKPATKPATKAVPKPAAAPRPAPSVAEDEGVAAVPAASQDQIDRVLGLLRNLKIPEGFQREMIIIGNSAYSVAEKKQEFLGKKKVEKSLEPIGSLPEGVFFAEGYSPRVLVENGFVLAIEFLKKEAAEYTEAAEPVEPVSLKQHLKSQENGGEDLVHSLGFRVKKS
jgi:hypothetical protein